MFCTLHAYAAVYLLDRGFTNTQIGILLAVANITSAVAQPLVAAVIDNTTAEGAGTAIQADGYYVLYTFESKPDFPAELVYCL